MSYYPPGGVPPRRTPWLIIIIIGAVLLAALLIVGVAITAVLVAGGDDETSSAARTTDVTSPPSTSASATTGTVTSALPTTPRDAVLGTWSGVYVCGQGDTRLRLAIDPGPGPADVTAVFAFGPTEENPDVPRGSYRMEGTLAEGVLDLHATTWIKQPRGYVTVDLRAPVAGEDPPQIMGDVLGASVCSTFAVVRHDG